MTGNLLMLCATALAAGMSALAVANLLNRRIRIPVRSDRSVDHPLRR